MSTLFIFYGSATGNAEQIAKDLASKPPPSPFTKIECNAMEKFKKYEKAWESSPTESSSSSSSIVKHGMILVTSTTGNGDSPENAGRFVRYLKRKTTVEKQPFQHVAYATLGLGDTNYDQFCATAKIVDKKMMELGGTRIQPLECADEGTGNLESVVEPWSDTIFQNMVQAVTPQASSEGEGGDQKKEESSTSKEKETPPTTTTTTTAPSLTTAAVDSPETSSSSFVLPADTKSPSPLVILYGSATGNAEQIAKDLCATYKAILQNPDSNCYFPDVICCEADQFKKQKLVETHWSKPPPHAPQQKHGVLVITSTTGNGDVPENAGRFVRFLKRKTTVEQQPFQHVAYATLGLGDTNYDQFCATAKLVDKKLMELGGTRIQPLECADEGTGNLESVVDPWVNTILYTITKACRGEKEEEDSAAGTANTSSTPKTGTTAPVAAAVVATPQVGAVQAPTKSNSTISNSTVNSSNEEKKMDTMDSTNGVEPQQQQKPSTSVGVQILRSLICSSSSSSSSSLAIPQVDHSCLPSLGTRLSSCELIHHGQEDEKEEDGGGTDQRRRSRGYSLVEMAEQMTVSSASSTALHYTIANPYESTILNARYLTNTSTQASKTVCDTIGVHNITTKATTASTSSSSSSESNTASDNTNNDKYMIEATDVYNNHFPLVPSSSKDSSTTTTTKDEMVLFGQNSKRVIEMTLALPDDYTLEYKPGDSLGLLVPNTPQDVQFVLDMLQRHHSMETSTQQVSLDSQQPITVEEAVRHHIDLGSPLKQNNKRILHYLSQFATHPEEETALRLLASKTTHGEELFRQYVEDQCLTVVDILRDFPSCQSIPLEGLLGVLPGIPPRYYSVSSSPLDKQHSKSSSTLSLTVTFSVVDYVTPPLIISENDNVCGGKRRKRGIATGYLELLCSPFLAAADDGSDGSMVQLSTPPQLKIFPKPTAEFRLPENITTPLVLIGPGTGIAPFMGFLSHRQAEITAIESTEAATSVVEGTWRGDYELEGDDAIPITKTDSSGLNMGIEFRRNQNVGSVDVFFGCRYANHDWLYQKELEHYQTNGTISKLYTAFSRDAGGSTSAGGATSDRNNVKRSGYVQDIMRNDPDCRSRLINLILKDNASVYVCGDGNAMARDVQAAIVDLLTVGLEENTSKGDREKETSSSAERAKKYLENMKAQERFVLDIWTS